MRNNLLSRSIKSAIKNHVLLTFLMFLSFIMSVALTLIAPLILEQIINNLSQNHTGALYLGIIYFSVIALSSLVDIVKIWLISVFGQNVTMIVRQEMCNKLTRVKASYFSINSSALITSRFTSDVSTLETLFSSGIMSLIVDVCKIIGVLIMIFVKNVGTGFVMLTITPMIIAFTAYVRKKMFVSQKNVRKYVGVLSDCVVETLHNVRCIKLFGGEKYMLNLYDKSLDNYYEASDKNNMYDAVYSPIITVVSAFLIAIVFVLSINDTTANIFGMNAGVAAALIAYIGKIFSPIESVGKEIQTLQSAAAGIDRINEFGEQAEKPQQNTVIKCEKTCCFDNSIEDNVKHNTRDSEKISVCKTKKLLKKSQKSEIYDSFNNKKAVQDTIELSQSAKSLTDRQKGIFKNKQSKELLSNSITTQKKTMQKYAMKFNNGISNSEFVLPRQNNTDVAISLDNVTFGYNDSLPILKNFNLIIKKGEYVILTGRTGCGKSTILNLILGFYSPNFGDVSVMGLRSDRLLDESKSRLIGYVAQTFYAVNGTITDQVNLFDANLTEKDAVQATRIVGLEDYISSLPNGFDTRYNPNLFSQGQQQLLSIARAIVRNPKILLFDEITANLDSASEKNVLDAIVKVSKNKTIVAVSHRLSQMNNYREIVIK